jgi:hypothetical protein
MVNIRWAIIGLIFCFLVYGAFYSESAPSRHAKNICQAKLIFEEKGDVDIALIGSSRAMAAFNALTVESELKRVRSGRYVVYDLSRSWPGVDYFWVMARDLIENRRVKNLIIPLHWRHARNHPMFQGSAKFSDFVTDILVGPNTLKSMQRATIGWSQRFTERLSDLRKRPLRPLSFEASREAKSGECPSVKGYSPDALWQGRLERENTRDQELVWNFGEKNVQRYIRYVKKIQELAESRGVNLVFVYIPGFLEPKVAEDSMEQLRKMGLKVHQPDRQVVDSWLSRGYRDRTHMSEVGERQFAKWLVREVLWQF